MIIFISDQAIPDVHPETLYSLQGTANTQDPEPVYENPEDLHPDFIYSNVSSYDNSTRSTDEEDWSEDEFSEFEEQVEVYLLTSCLNVVC